jgi:hypothetical protein
MFIQKTRTRILDLVKLNLILSIIYQIKLKYENGVCEGVGNS